MTRLIGLRCTRGDALSRELLICHNFLLNEKMDNRLINASFPPGLKPRRDLVSTKVETETYKKFIPLEVGRLETIASSNRDR